VTEALYRYVASELKAAILGGALTAGARLPSESELATRYAVSRGTVRQAFATLRAEGVIASRQGARRVVLDSRRQSFGELRSFSLWARSVGAVPSGRVLSIAHRPASHDEIEELDLDSAAQVCHMTRLRLLDGRPAMIERTTYPERVGKLLSGIDAEAGSITEALEGEGVVFAHADHVIDAVAATAEDARLLEVRARYPLLRARRRTTDPAGAPVEWSDDRYLGDAVAFTVHNSAATNPLSRLAQ
jgi:GntR family transcriptional regulator